MKRLALTTSIVALMSSAAIAQSMNETPDTTPPAQHMENAMDEAATGMSEAADNVGTTMSNAMDEVGETLSDAATTTGNAFSETGQAIENSADTMSDSMTGAMDSDPLYIRSRDITGGAIYTTEGTNDSWADNVFYPEVNAEWTHIGEIEDLVLDENGQMIGVIAEVGGFLGIGDKHVMLPLTDVNLAAIDDGNFAVVTQQSREQLMNQPDVDEGFWD